MKTMTLAEADPRLVDLILHLIPGEELTITVDGQPVARIHRCKGESRAGCGKTEGFWMAPDFDAPMDENGDFVG